MNFQTMSLLKEYARLFKRDMSDYVKQVYITLGALTKVV